MKPIAIVPRAGHEIGVELHDALAYLRSVEIYARNAAIGRAFALIWVDDKNILDSVESLRIAGFQATALTKTDVPH
jgi:hypothetical protein